MKNIIMLCLIAGFLFPVAAEAQFEKDKVLIGLSTRMGIYEMTSSTSTDIFSLGFSSIKIKSDADNYEEPPSDKFGDLSSNICLQISKDLGTPPKTIAENIINSLKIPKDRWKRPWRNRDSRRH